MNCKICSPTTAGHDSLPESLRNLLAQLDSIAWSEQQEPAEEATQKLLRVLSILKDMGTGHLAVGSIRRLLAGSLLVAGAAARLPRGFSQKTLGEGVLAAVSHQVEARESGEGVAFLADVGTKGLEALTHLAEGPGPNLEGAERLRLLETITRR